MEEFVSIMVDTIVSMKKKLFCLCNLVAKARAFTDDRSFKQCRLQLSLCSNNVSRCSALIYRFT